MVYQNTVAQPRDELTDVIVEGLTDDMQFVGLKLFPPQPLQLPQGHVPKITIAKGDLMRSTTKVRTPGANFDRWQSAIDDFSLSLVQVSEEVVLPDEQTMMYEDYFSIETFYATEASNRLKRGLEIDAEGALFNTGTGFFDSVNSTVAYSTANVATFDPIGDIIAAIRRLKARGEAPDTIVASGPLYDRIRTGTLVKSFIAGSLNPGSVVTPETIQASLANMGIKNFWVSDTYVNLSQELNTNDIEPIFPMSYIFVGKVGTGALQTGGFGRTFYWAKEGPVLNVSSYRDEPKKSNVIRAMKTTITAVTNARAGTLIASQVTS